MQTRVLVVDDDKELGELLNDYLCLEGFYVDLAEDGEQGLSLALGDNHYDIVLLDVMLPKLDGFEVLRKLRISSYTPVIMLTAKDESFERIYGLELGADDYLAKPFNSRELLARIKALLRRVEYSTTLGNDVLLQIGQLSLDNKKQQVRFNQQLMPFTGSEFYILQLLAINKGRLTKKMEISKRVFGRELVAFDRSIDMHISNIRSKIAVFSSSEVIRTIRGGGYMLIEP